MVGSEPSQERLPAGRRRVPTDGCQFLGHQQRQAGRSPAADSQLQAPHTPQVVTKQNVKAVRVMADAGQFKVGVRGCGEHDRRK